MANELCEPQQPPSAAWERRFAELEAYQAEYGHANVPRGWEIHPRLGEWVSKQREMKDTMPAARRRKLDGLGFAWAVREEAPCELSEQRFAELQAYQSWCGWQPWASHAGWQEWEQGYRAGLQCCPDSPSLTHSQLTAWAAMSIETDTREHLDTRDSQARQRRERDMAEEVRLLRAWSEAWMRAEEQRWQEEADCAAEVRAQKERRACEAQLDRKARRRPPVVEFGRGCNLCLQDADSGASGGEGSLSSRESVSSSSQTSSANEPAARRFLSDEAGWQSGFPGATVAGVRPTPPLSSRSGCSEEPGRQRSPSSCCACGGAVSEEACLQVRQQPPTTATTLSAKQTCESAQDPFKYM